MADNNGSNTAGAGAEKTFTQAELDAIIGDRLAREKAKYTDYDSLKEKAEQFDKLQEEGKTELQKANDKAASLQKELDQLKSANNVRKAREKVSQEMSVPVELLTGEDEETCKKQAEAILKFAKPKSYPGTKGNSRKQAGSTSTDDGMREFAHQIFGKGE